MSRYAIQSRNSNVEQYQTQSMNKFVKLFKNNNVTQSLTQLMSKCVIQSMNKFAIQFMIKFVKVHSHHMVYLAVELEVLLVEVETLLMVQCQDMELLLLLLVGKYPDRNAKMYPVNNVRTYQNRYQGKSA